jgi:hypothetical protein
MILTRASEGLQENNCGCCGEFADTFFPHQMHELHPAILNCHAQQENSKQFNLNNHSPLVSAQGNV